MELETKKIVMLPQANECWELPAAGQGKGGFSARAIRSVALMTPGFQMAGLRSIHTDCCGLNHEICDSLLSLRNLFCFSFVHIN